MAQAAFNGREPCREFMVRGTKFEVAEKYGLIKVSASACPTLSSTCSALRVPCIIHNRSLAPGSQAVGKGAYGVVCSCRDTTTGRKVAVKKVGDAFNDETDAKRTLREIKLLRFLNHDNVRRNRRACTALYCRISSPLLPSPLFDYSCLTVPTALPWLCTDNCTDRHSAACLQGRLQRRVRNHGAHGYRPTPDYP